MIYYESPQAKVSWNEELKAAVLEWKCFAQGEQYRTPCQKASELLKEKKAVKMLLDNRKMSVIHSDDQAWVAQVIHPQNIAAGMKYVASVTPEKVIAKASIKRAVGEVLKNGEFFSESFDSVEEANQWLS
jgi:hypothetical protein